MTYEPVIGLEVHAELLTASKMFCGCRVVDSTVAEPNTHVCPVCSGMPGMLPVINRKAVEYAIRVALALGCEINQHNVFARKNYFYPDLPKGYQISQYELPLGERGQLTIDTEHGPKVIRVRRVHLEEDTGKLFHVDTGGGDSYSLIDLNRSGVPLLEIVSEPDMRSAEEARAYATKLRAILRYLGVNSGDMEKGVIRFEANVSVREAGSDALNTRREIKNLNSFRALVRASEAEIERQIATYAAGGKVEQETLGWNEARGEIYAMRSKEEAHDYRYFPEPDLPPLWIEQTWIDQVRAALPELPDAIQARYVADGLPADDAAVIVDDQAVVRYFDEGWMAARARANGTAVSIKTLANWVTGELFGVMNAAGDTIDSIKVSGPMLVELIALVEDGTINQTTAKAVLREMYETGKSATTIVDEQGLKQVSDVDQLVAVSERLIDANPDQLASYLGGKETIANWFFGQVMREMRGQANPQVVKQVLNEALARRKQD